MPMLWRSAVLGAGLLAASAGLSAHAGGDGGIGGNGDWGFGNGIKRVLLISIDGMHALDFINCSQGISGVNGGTPYCPNLAALAADWCQLSRGFHFEAVRFLSRADGIGQRRLAANRRCFL